MKPCPSCGWMLKDTDNVCNMCGASVGGGGAPAPPPMAAAPPPPVVNSGAYAAPGPPGMQGYPSAPAMARPPPVGPPPVSQYGAVAPPPPVNAYGQQPPPPPTVGPMAGYGQPQAQPGAEMPFTPSPWARAAVPAAPPPAPPPPQAPPSGMQAAPPSPIAMVPGMPGAPAPVTGGYGAVPAPVTGGYGQPPSPITSNPYGNQQQPAISFGQPPPGGPAPPPMIPGAVARPAGIAPPGIVQPPMMAPGALPGAPGMVSRPPAVPDGPKVLVGFLVTFQNDPSGSFWPIHSGRTALGRSAGEGIDIALQDASASSRHASIHADPATGQAFVEDDGSRNGSFLNEARLTSGERRQLRDNDRLRLGSTTFVVKLLVS